MRRVFKFYWLCVKDAWRGSIEAANAWAAIIGAFLIWVVLALRGYRLMLPETFLQGIVLTTLCLVAAWIALFAVRFMRALPAAYWRERDRADKTDAELKIALKRPDADDTKWTIKELFHHIDQDYLENKSWETIGDDLRDALSQGRLTMWGRLKETDSGPWVGPRAALTPIEKTYWYKAYFTYFFFYPEPENGVHCYADRKTGRPAYTDLQVSRREVLVLWPGEPEDIAENYPNVRIADNPSIHESILGSGDRQKFLGLLSAGVLTAWARPMRGRRDFIRVPQGWWETYYIDVRLKFSETVENNNAPTYQNQSFLKTRGTREVTHYDVCVNRAQMSKVWNDLRFVLDRGSGA